MTKIASGGFRAESSSVCSRVRSSTVSSHRHSRSGGYAAAANNGLSFGEDERDVARELMAGLCAAAIAELARLGDVDLQQARPARRRWTSPGCSAGAATNWLRCQHVQEPREVDEDRRGEACPGASGARGEASANQPPLFAAGSTADRLIARYFICMRSLVGGTIPLRRRYTTMFP